MSVPVSRIGGQAGLVEVKLLSQFPDFVNRYWRGAIPPTVADVGPDVGNFTVGEFPGKARHSQRRGSKRCRRSTRTGQNQMLESDRVRLLQRGVTAERWKLAGLTDTVPKVARRADIRVNRSAALHGAGVGNS